MTYSCQHSVSVQEIGESLANYSLDRESVLFALSRLPDEPSINKVVIEYEIQLLKILSVGWGISYFMEDHLEKSPLIKKFWDVLFEFSKKYVCVTIIWSNNNKKRNSNNNHHKKKKKKEKKEKKVESF